MNDLEYCQSNDCRKDLSQYLKIDIESFSLPSCIYQYRKFSKRTIENLLNKKIILSNPNTFNDVYDSYLHANTLTKLENEIEILNQLLPGFNYTLTDERKAEQIKLDKFTSNKFLNLLRIACFSSNFNDIKMWGLYSDNNRGICIKYNIDEINKNLSKLFFPVFYIDKPIDVTGLLKENKVMLALLISIINKYKIWSYENEYRLILPLLTEINDNYIPVENIPNPKRIIFGKKFTINGLLENDKKMVPIFKEYLLENEIEIFKCYPIRNSYKIEIKETYVDDIF